MRIIILGAGTTGMQLARSLVADQHRVTLMDRDADRVQDAANQLDCAVVHITGIGLDVLEEAGIASADALVAVGGSDEQNLMACALVDAVYPGVQKIARVSSADYFGNFIVLSSRWAQQGVAGRRPPFGIDWMVNPNAEMSRCVTRELVQRRTCGVLNLEGGYSVLALTLGAASPLAGRTVERLKEVRDWRYRVLSVYDPAQEAAPVLAMGDTVLRAGLRTVILARTEDVKGVVTLCDAAEVNRLRVLMAGISPLATLMVGGVMQRNGVPNLQGCWLGRVSIEPAIVDESPERCRALVERFPDLKVFCGDVTDAGLLGEEGLDRYDMSLSFTDRYDRNLITSAYLKSCGIPCTVALTANADVAGMAKRLGVDVAIPVCETVVESIKNHLYGRNVLQVESVAKGAFDLVYCNMTKHGRIPDDAVLLLIRGKDETAYRAPDAHTELAAGDRLLLMVPAGRLEAVRKAIG